MTESTNLVNADLLTVMSSLELVEFINLGRKARAEVAGRPFPSKGHSELLHSHFIKKIETHPGIHSDEFSSQYKDSTGRTLKCYLLPEREARLMVMSESLEAQTKVLDRLMQLEAAAARLQIMERERTQLRLEADYRENLKHCDEHEVGKALISAVKCSDEDGEGVLHEALQGIDFSQAARAYGVSEEHIKARTLAHISATHFVGQLQRGEHRHKDLVMDVIQWARSVVSSRRAKAEILEHQKREALRHQTLAQIDAYDMIHKHDNPFLQVGPAPRKRALRKQPTKKPK